MAKEIVGSVSRLWRFPVKSMLGEEVEEASVVWSGFYGNRSYALIDMESSKLVSAKNPAKWSKMFGCRSTLVGQEDLDKPPRVRVTLPDGRSFDISEGSYGGAEEALTELLGRSVRFAVAREKPAPMTIEQYHPEIDEDPDAGTTTEFLRSAPSQAGTFTDSGAVHLVSTASLGALSDIYPSGVFDPLRFRPNVLVDTAGAKGFVERGWVGKTLALGDEVKLGVYKECGRCVMTTLAQGDLRSDTGVLSTVIRFNRGKVGVFASVLKGGTVRKEDRAILE